MRLSFILAMSLFMGFSAVGQEKKADVTLLLGELRTVKAANAQLAEQVTYLTKQLELQRKTYQASVTFLGMAKEAGEKACGDKPWRVEEGTVVCEEKKPDGKAAEKSK